VESANVKVQKYFTGEITLHVAQIVNIEQLQIYPRNMVCFRYMIVNTLHKGNNKDNNNKQQVFKWGTYLSPLLFNIYAYFDRLQV
jgi:hypothetical protein